MRFSPHACKKGPEFLASRADIVEVSCFLSTVAAEKIVSISQKGHANEAWCAPRIQAAQVFALLDHSHSPVRRPSLADFDNYF